MTRYLLRRVETAFQNIQRHQASIIRIEDGRLYLFLFLFLILILTLILDLDKACNIISCIMVIQVTKCDRNVTLVTKWSHIS